MSEESSKSISKHARARARRSAVQAFYQWQMTEGPMSLIIKEFESDRANELKRADKDYFKEILLGMSQLSEEIEDILQTLIDRSLKEIDPVERSILHLGVYELKYRHELPWRVVLNESIELAKMFGAEESHKYINGVLDKAAHQIRPDESQNM